MLDLVFFFFFFQILVRFYYVLCLVSPLGVSELLISLASSMKQMKQRTPRELTTMSHLALEVPEQAVSRPLLSEYANVFIHIYTASRAT